MFFIVGLGNPGEIYTYTRHNVGKLFVSYLGESKGFSAGKGNFFYKETRYGMLIIPAVYMNESGIIITDLKKNLCLKKRSF